MDEAQQIANWIRSRHNGTREDIAAAVERGDWRKPPPWPPAELLDAAYGTYFERDRVHLENARTKMREAFLKHDPVIRAAINLSSSYDENTALGPLGQALLDALSEAGLLEQSE